MTQMIYHMCRADEWAAAVAAKGYHGSSQDESEGFIHFSDQARQIVESARRHHAGQAGLVLVAVDAEQLGERVRWEPSRGGDSFPHLYGPLDPGESARVEPLPLGPDGLHEFPANRSKAISLTQWRREPLTKRCTTSGSRA